MIDTIERFVKLKRSAELGKTPTAEQLDYGEVALNYNAEEPFLSIKDSNNNIQKIPSTQTVDKKLRSYATTAYTETTYIKKTDKIIIDGGTY